jgi:archaellum biogenesis protein FlaJ (TadC family)
MTSSILPGLIFIDRGDLLLAALIFVITFAGSLGIISLILVKIPSDYFRESHSRDFAADHGPVFRWATKIGKNVLGAVLVLLGILMSLPGVPGQGVLTILLGIMLLDLPGKRRLEQKILKQPKVLKKINSLRQKFSKPPLLLD